jgi:hypothetical protein
MDSPPFVPTDVTVAVDEGTARYLRQTPEDATLLLSYTLDGGTTPCAPGKDRQGVETAYHGELAIHGHVIRKIRKKLLPLLAGNPEAPHKLGVDLADFDASRMWQLGTDGLLRVHGREFGGTIDTTVNVPGAADAAVAASMIQLYYEGQRRSLETFYVEILREIQKARGKQ